jgi:hypothetical protein
MNNGVHFKVNQQRTSYHSGTRQQMGLLMLPEHRCATKGKAVDCATTMGQTISGALPFRMWGASFNNAPGTPGSQHEVQRFRSFIKARCSQPGNLTMRLCGTLRAPQLGR